ncbi:rop guanine nucleotide exchange factor 14-like isoform X2 [Hevea brasiliensis]|nr:rop guanine nucleotide exchange factor 14-like isoform X2 [Hevea brasiliensis]
MTYNGLESCIQNNQSYENESGTSQGDRCMSDSSNDDNDLSFSSSKDAFGSFSSKWLTMKKDELSLDDWELSESPQHFYVKAKQPYTIQFSDVETMNEKFAKLLLGEDLAGGCKGLTTALALSNAITNLAASVFGELWKLEPLPEQSKNKWRKEMDWLLSPTNYMVELVPTKQNGANGKTVEIMTPKARADIHVNLPALQKLDSMLITLDSMVNTELWFTEVGSRAEGESKSKKQRKRWWPQVPKTGLSDSDRKKLLYQSVLVYQVFKAAKSINENILLEMPVPTIIRDALPKSGKANLGEELYKILAADSKTTEVKLSSLNLKSEHAALETINKLEAAIFAWKEKVAAQVSSKFPVRTSWSFMSEFDKIESLLDRAETLLRQVKARRFLEAKKIQYGRDVGHSTLEAYSRVLGNLALNILSRIWDILQEEASSNQNSPATMCCFPGIKVSRILDSPVHFLHTRHTFLCHMNKVDGKYRESDASYYSDKGFSYSEAKARSVNATPSRRMVWRIGR